MPFQSSVRNIDEFLETARNRFDYAMACDKEDREEAIEDVKFQAGGINQWDKRALEARRKLHRPVLVENRLPTFVAQVVNDGRQSKPSIRITPMDDGEPKTAEMLQSRIRHIEYDCDADIAYDTSREQQTISGRGFYRITITGGDRPQPCIRRIANQFTVLWDPSSKEYDCSDARWWFVVETISRERHEELYGKNTLVSEKGWYDRLWSMNPAPSWINIGKAGQEVQHAEYWLREEGEPVMQYTINGAEILDERPWLGSWIPIIPVWGREMYLEGRRRTYSLIRNAKDPQRLVNLYVSNIAEQIAMMPKTPFMGPKGMFTNFEGDWESINITPKAYVEYNNINDGTSKSLGGPQRVVNEPPIQALTIGLNQAVEAIKASMGIFDASIGAKGNETSGIAIERRQHEADNANFHFHDNEARSRRYCGRQLLELIQKLDGNEEKTVPIRSETGKTKLVRINTATPYRDEETGEAVHYRLDEGSYSVAVSTGPSYTSGRQEQAEKDSRLIESFPELMWIMGDLYFANQDAPGAEERAQRMKRAIAMKTPGLIENGGQQVPPQIQAQIQSMQQELQAAHGFAQKLFEEQKAKTLDVESRERIEAMNVQSRERIAAAQLELQREQLQVERELGAAKFGSVEALRSLQLEIDSIKHSLDLQRAAVEQRDEQAHELEMQQGAQEHERQMQTAQHSHEADQADQAAEVAAMQQASEQAHEQQQAEMAQKEQPATKE